MFELVDSPRLENPRVHLHRYAQLGPKPVLDIPLLHIILGIDPRLDLFVVYDAHSKALLHLRSAERRSSFLDLCEAVANSRASLRSGRARIQPRGPEGTGID